MTIRLLGFTFAIRVFRRIHVVTKIIDDTPVTVFDAGDVRIDGEYGPLGHACVTGVVGEDRPVGRSRMRS